MSLFFLLPTARQTLAQLSGVSDPLSSSVSSGGNRPRVGIRFNSDGTIDEGSGDHLSMSYSEVGAWVDDLGDLDGSEWQVTFTIDSEDNGDPGTWSGSTTGSPQALSSNRTYEWTKDGTDAGTANSVVTILIENIADTSNSSTKSNVDYDCTILV